MALSKICKFDYILNEAVQSLQKCHKFIDVSFNFQCADSKADFISKFLSEMTNIISDYENKTHLLWSRMTCGAVAADEIPQVLR